MMQIFLRRKDVYLPALMVILLGAALRLYSFYFSSLLFNIDGIFYLQQAKALYLGEFERFTACYWYPNIYPVLVVPFYWLMGHWVIAAKTTSFVFGTATLIPLYFILRHFFDRQMATCVLVLAAVNPFLVKSSSDVMRGPVFWFFTSLGLALFIACFSQKRRWLFLCGSCLSYMLAAWSRIDAVVFILSTPVFIILLGERQRKIKDLCWFLSPLLVLGAVSCLLVALQGDGSSAKGILPRDVFAGLQMSFDTYNQTREGLHDLAKGGTHLAGIPTGFFSQCRNLIPWIAFADTLILLMGMSFQPFFLFFLFGFKNIWHRLRQDVKLRYLLLMGLGAFSLVILQEMYSWFMSARFIVLSFLPLLVFFGFGLERFVVFVEGKRNWSRVAILLGLSAVFFVVTLPKNMKHYRADKAIFREIGEFIAEQEGGAEVVNVAGFFKRVGYTNVFANLEADASPCCNDYWLADSLHGDNLLSNLQRRDVDYFVWEEKYCSAAELSLLQQPEVKEVTSWQTKRLGKMVLFKLPQEALE